MKLAIESRHEEHEEDTFTPLIAGRPGVSASGKKDPVEDVDGEQKPTRLALYEVGQESAVLGLSYHALC